ncbi:hypothetical protein [Streptomyces sp. NPDC052036]|uniref:alpha/beta fold hydrolase n=1 Tax=Streptomyces sp. NPDC052036 TaxID=3155171 RepID=UPI00342004F5
MPNENKGQMMSSSEPGAFVEAPDGTLVHFIDLDLHAEALAEAIPGATVRIIPGEGHYAIAQVPERVTPLLAEALGIPDELVPKR